MRRKHSLAMDMTMATATGIWARRRQLAPALAATCTVPTALTAHGVATIPQAAPYVIAAGALGVATATAAAYTQPDYLRAPAYATVATLATTGTWAAIDPWSAHPWGVMALATMGCQTAWMVGRAMLATDRDAKATKRGEKMIENGKWDATISSLSRTKQHVEWRLALGTGTRAYDIGTDTVAHILGVKPDRVHIYQGATTRECTIKLMHHSPPKAPARHPALRAATRDEWQPGALTVTEPIPVGPSGSGTGPDITMSPRPDDDIAHMLIAGQTGSGKSYSLAALLTGLMACSDVILAGADVPKAGQTLSPFLPAFAKISQNIEALTTDMHALDALSKQRISRMNKTGDDKWDPKKHGPVIVYVLEEWAATLTEAAAMGIEADTSDMLDKLASTVRSAGIALLVCTQRPDRESMGSTRLRSNIQSSMIHKIAKPADAMGIVPREELDLSALTRKGDALIFTAGNPVERGRPWKVDPKDRRDLAIRYQKRPQVTPEEATILSDAGWQINTGEHDHDEVTMPDWAGQTLADADTYGAPDGAVLGLDDVKPIPVDAPATMIVWALTEALGDDDRITPDDVIDAIGWTTEHTSTSERNAAKARLKTAIRDVSGTDVKTVERRTPGTQQRARYYMRDHLAQALTTNVAAASEYR